MAPGRGEEIDLFRRCARGEPGAWDEFLRRYRPGIEAGVRRLLALRGAARPEEVDECVSEVLLALLRDDRAKLRAYDGRASPGTWLGLVAITAVGNRVRVERRRGTIPLGDLDREPAGPGTPPPGAREDRAGALRRALESLDARQRLALRLAYEKAWSRREIARAMRLTEGAVAQILFRARGDLRARIARDSREIARNPGRPGEE